MKRKKILKVLGIFLLVMVLLIGGYMFVNSLKFKNIFDEMYYAWADYPQSLATQPGYWRTEPLAGHPTFAEISASEDLGFLHLIYKDEYMMPKTQLSISICKDSGDLDLRGDVEYAESENLFFDFYYNEDEKALTIECLTVFTKKIIESKFGKQYTDAETVESFLLKHNITKEEIEKYKDYFLNEVAIGSWADGNGAFSKFSRNNPGKFSIVDNTYSLLSAEWQQ